MKPSRLVASSSLALSLIAATAGCAAKGGTADGPLKVAADFYPVQFLADRVGGDLVEVTDLTPAGTEPHDLALTGKSRAALQDADVALYLGANFQPDVQSAVHELPKSVLTDDLLAAPGITLRTAPAELGKESLSGNKDPHVWLDPRNMIALSRSVEKAFAKKDPAHASTYDKNQKALETDLTALDGEYRQGLAHCDNTTIVTSHAAFGYLADDFGLTQVAIAGLSPDDEPDPATLAKITQVATAAHVGTVFFEEALSPALSKTVAQEIGAKTDLLAALEFQPQGSQDYLSVMRGNLQRLVKGLGCR